MTTGHASGELLGRIVPGVLTPVTLYQADELRTEITLFVVVQAPLTGGATANIIIFHDDNGTTYDITTALAAAVVTKDADGLTAVFQAQHPGSGIMIKPGGSIGVQSSQINETVFTIYGVTETLAERIRPSR